MSRGNHIQFAMAVLAGKDSVTLPIFPARLGLSRAADRWRDDFCVADQACDGSSYLHALIQGHPDPMGPHILGRLAVLRALYLARGEDDMLDLVRRASKARAAALQAADVAFLQSLIDGDADYFDDQLYKRLESLHDNYQGDAEIRSLFNRAAAACCDAVVLAAQWTLAGLDAVDAIDKARGFE